MIPRRNFDKDKTFRLKLKTFIFGGRKWTPLRIMNCHVPLALPPNTFLKIFFFFPVHYSVGIEFIKNFTDFFLISQLALCSVTTLLYQILRIPSSYKKRNVEGCTANIQVKLPSAQPRVTWILQFHSSERFICSPCHVFRIFLRAKWQIIAGNGMQLAIKSIQQNEEWMLKVRVFPSSCWDLVHIGFVCV